MLISCFQCRQQLDVPEDSAGKRVRCAHCQYVIVVPAKPRAAEPDSLGPAEPATALPHMELDPSGEKPPAAMKLPAQPLPPLEIPAPPPNKSQPRRIDDEAADMPSIDRASRRRRQPMPVAPAGTRWGRILGIGALVATIAIAVTAVVISSAGNRRPRNQANIAFNPQVQMRPPQNRGFNPGNANVNGQVRQAIAPAIWKDFQKPQHAFKAQFPGQPVQNGLNIFNAPALMAFEVKQ